MKTKCAYCKAELDREPRRALKGNCYCNARCQMAYEYGNGIRDRYTTTEAAHKAMHRLIDMGEWSLQKPENHIKSNRNLGHKNYGKTWLEEKMGWALNKLGIKFESQYPIKYGVDILNRPRYYFPDFAIPEGNLLIECDGSYWHKNKKRENLRESRLKELGWNIIRFSDNDIETDLMGCAQKVCRFLAVIP